MGNHFREWARVDPVAFHSIAVSPDETGDEIFLQTICGAQIMPIGISPLVDDLHRTATGGQRIHRSPSRNLYLRAFAVDVSQIFGSASGLSDARLNVWIDTDRRFANSPFTTEKPSRNQRQCIPCNRSNFAIAAGILVRGLR